MTTVIRPQVIGEILPTINNPKDVKELSEKQLPILAEEIRQELIWILSQTGGHLGPNLGVVELTIALHRAFDTPKDKLIFDVSHQGYIHKMLTGRRTRLATLRQYQGLNGFLLRTESEHDAYGAGHAGTALSAGLGMAAARDLTERGGHIVVVAGDAAFTCGISFEALNNVVATTSRFIIILNDNEWSIAKNVGAIAEYLNRITTNSAYAHLHEKAGQFVEWLAGKQARKLVHKAEVGLKNLLAPNVLFEDLGIHYLGPIDGHDISLLIKTFEFLKVQNEPVLLHILTKKGKGYKPALERPDKFHGLGRFHLYTGETVAITTPTYSELLGKHLADFADQNNKIIAITAAMPTGSGLAHFAHRHPTRFFDVGIAEEHAALFACGLASQGMKPFLAIYSTFMQRAFDMIIHDMALQNLNICLCMDRAGLASDDGPTHHGLFDIGYIRHIPGMVHMQPRDEVEFRDMLWTMLHYQSGPIAIRYPRGIGTGVKSEGSPRLLEVGKSEVLHHGTQVALFGLGNMCEVALETAELLKKEGISTAVINARWIKPLDSLTLESFAHCCSMICTLEDHVLHNGFGSAVLEHLSDAHIATPVLRIGWPDNFIEHGAIAILRQKYGVTAKAAASRISAFFSSHLPQSTTIA